MDAKRPVDSPSVQSHKRQLAWQILVPFLLVVALFIAVAVLVSTRSPATIRPVADVSIIWLIAPMLLVALMFVTVLGFLIYGLARLLQIAPKYTAIAQLYIAGAAARVHKVADGSTKPIIWTHQAGAIFKSIFKI